MLLVEVPWASRVWALPFLSALASSERYAAERGKRHKKKSTSTILYGLGLSGHTAPWFLARRMQANSASSGAAYLCSTVPLRVFGRIPYRH
jgi:hypothetical protein